MRPSGNYGSLEQIETLVCEFEACTLSGDQWTHAAHLTVALWYLTRASRDDATLLIRSGIQKYNKSRGVQVTKEGGYHETITLFSIWAIGRYLSGVAFGASLVDLANGLIGGQFGDKRLALQYYSKIRLMSWKARLGWVEPDLKPLDDSAGVDPGPASHPHSKGDPALEAVAD